MQKCRPVLGVDVGQAQDNSALVLISRRGQTVWYVDYTEKIALGTPYKEVAKHVQDTVSSSGAVVVLDATGVGRVVSELLQDAGVAHYPITITGGVGWNGANVSKVALVTGLRAAMERGEVKIPAEHADLISQLRAFRVVVRGTSAEAYQAAPGEHDDLVLALALAMWGTAVAEVEEEDRLQQEIAAHVRRVEDDL